MSRRNLFAVCGVTVLAVAVTACGSDDKRHRPRHRRRPRRCPTFTITDTGCDPATATADAGELTFAVKNSTSTRAEFEIVTAAPAIALEKFLAAGESGTYEITLPAGDYRLICGSPLSDEGTLTLTGSGGADATAPTGTAVDQAVARRRRRLLHRVRQRPGGRAADQRHRRSPTPCAPATPSRPRRSTPPPASRGRRSSRSPSCSPTATR